MNVEYSITVLVDGDPVTTDCPQMRVSHFLELASEQTGRSKLGKVLLSEAGTAYLNRSLTLLLRHGATFTTRNP